MSRKEISADYEAALKNCFDRWEYLKEHGGSEQGTPCGENRF